MTDTFFDNAGGLQTAPEMTVKQVEDPAYVAADGSLQTALSAEILNGSLPANQVVVTDGDSVLLRLANSSGIGRSANLNVANNELVDVELTSDATVLKDAQALTIPVTGTYVDTVTFTVANGQVTGIVLS